MDETFEAITTQEAFESACLERVESAVRAEAKKYADYDALKKEQKAWNDEKKTMQSEINGYRLKELKQKVAAQKGIPLEAATRLQGTTEEELTSDADKLLPLLRSRTGTPYPLYKPQTVTGKYGQMLSGLLSK